MIPSVVVISTTLFGIEEIGTQLEEPFTVLPMQAFCDKIYNWCTEIVSWSPGDYGRPMRQTTPQHMVSNTEVANANGYDAAPAPAATQYAAAPEPVVIVEAVAVVPPSPPAPSGPSVQDLNAQWAAASRGQQ